MKKLLSILLALMITLSAFMGLGFSVSAEDADTLAVTVNGVTTNVKVGDTFTYTYTLTDMKALCAEAIIHYDSDFVEVNDVSEDDEDAYLDYLEQCFPVVNSTVVCNTEVTDTILYNFYTVSGIRFAGEQPLATFEFTAKAPGETTISTEMVELADTTTVYVDKTADGHEKINDYVYGEFVTYEKPEEPSSEEPSSEEPTTAPVVKVENVTVEPSVTTAIVSWDALEGAVQYWVYKNDGNGNWVIQKSSTTTSLVVKGLKGNSTYEFKVTAAVKQGDETKYLSLNDADVATTTTQSPIATDSISATAEELTATITWEAIEGAERYWLYRSTVGPDGPYYIHVSTDTNSYTDKKLRPETTYYYRVMALTYENGVACYSDPYDSPVTSATTGSASIIQVALTSSTATTVTINWPAFENADRYWVMSADNRADIVDNKKSTVWTSLTETSYTFSGLNPNSVYYFNVCARYIDEDTGKEEYIYYMPVIARTAYTDEEFIEFTPVDDTTVTLTWAEDISDISQTWVNVYNAEGTKVSVVKTDTNTATITGISGYENCYYELQVMDSQGRFGTLTKTGGERYHV